jgi:hypothetical protein
MNINKKTVLKFLLYRQVCAKELLLSLDSAVRRDHVAMSIM